MDATPAYRNDPPYLDIAIVVRKSLQLIGERPAALFGSVALSYLPMGLVVGGAGGILYTWLGRRGISAGTNEVLDILARHAPGLVVCVAAVVGAALVTSAWVEACVVLVAGDAYEGRASTVAGTLRAVYAAAPRAVVTRLLAVLGALPAVAFAALSLGLTSVFHLDAGVATLVGASALLIATLALAAYSTFAALALPAALFDDVGAPEAVRRAFVRTSGVRVYVALTWLVAWLGVLVASCVLHCGTSAVVLPMDIAFGQGTSQVAAAVAGQLLNLPLSVFLHAVGAITYGELIDKSVRPTAAVAEVFR